MKFVPRKAIWLGYWSLALVLTHMPPPQRPVQPFINDKLLHFVGYTILGFLTIWRMFPAVRRLAVRAALVWFCILVAYGAFDELTQPWFHRDCELLDWAADACGAAVGIAAALGYCRPATTRVCE